MVPLKPRVLPPAHNILTALLDEDHFVVDTV